jgi:hypothetical protein
MDRKKIISVILVIAVIVAVIVGLSMLSGKKAELPKP